MTALDNGTKTWTIRTLVSLVFVLLSIVAGYNRSEIMDLRAEFVVVRAEQLTRSGRIATLEAQMSSLTKQLERIEGKLDHVLERK